MVNVIHTRTYEITILGETYSLAEEEFKKLQPECREIAEYGVDLAQGEDWTGKVICRGGHAIDLRDEPEINAEPIEAAEMIKPMDTKALKVRIDKMEPHKSRREIYPYIEMHEMGRPIDAIKNKMLSDDFCPQGSLSYHIKKVLAASTRVTKIELESDSETSEQTIERLKAENKANTEKRKKPKIAMK